MKAIETVYKGYRFRSRLEARWAVFFDALAVRWEYEPEGFVLPSGRYLPDFRLPGDIVGWVEVKGAEPTVRERSLARELGVASGMSVFISCGMPDEPGYLLPDRRDTKVLLAHCLGPVRFQMFDTAVQAARGARFEHGESGAPDTTDPFEKLRR